MDVAAMTWAGMKATDKCTFDVPTALIAGAESIVTLSDLVPRFGGRVLIVTDDFLAGTSGFGRVKESVRRAGVEPRVAAGVVPEPTVESVDRVFRAAGPQRPDTVVAFGGGSVIDVAKAVCILFTNGGGIADYDGTDVYKVQPLPLIAIPTTAGTGSEMSTSVNATDTQHNAKLSVRHKWNRATVAILDPTVLAGIPKGVAVFPAIDAITHALEAYVSKQANPFSDAYAVEALRLFGQSFEAFLNDTSSIENAQAMQIGAAMAGVAFSSARTGYVHCLARAIGGRVKIPHGHACALGLASVIRFNRDHARERLAEAARLLLKGLKGEEALRDDGGAVAALIGYTQEFARRFDFPGHLSALGITHDDVNEMGKYASQLKFEAFTPRPATGNDLTQLLHEFF